MVSQRESSLVSSVSRVQFGNKGQGTIEYLLIIGVVIVLSLVVVGFILTQSDSIEQSSIGGNKLGMSVQSIGVTESLVDTDGNFVVRLLNNSGDVVTISDVSIGGTSVDFSEDLAQGNDKFFRVNLDESCEEGKVVSKDLVVTYVTKYGLTKTEIYPAKVMFNCSDFVINATFLADQCPSCVDPVYLHSGQTTSYDSGALDDKEQDGTAKSYTDNGDGTVTDNHTNLVWQKDHKDDCATLTWENALSYCSTLASGVDGLTDGSSAGDWRVPSFVELATLPDMSYPSSSYLNSVFTQTGWNDTCYGYWSNSTVPSSTSYAYNLYSDGGDLSNADKTFYYAYGVRCVRSES